MMANPARRFIDCSPLSLPLAGGLLMGLPKTLEPLAYIYDRFPRVPHAVLVRMKSTGRYYSWTGGSLQGIDQRKAAAALSWMKQYEEDGHDWKRNPWFDKDKTAEGEGGGGESAEGSASGERDPSQEPGA